MFKKIFIILLSLGFINLQSAAANAYPDDKESSCKFQTLVRSYEDIYKIQEPNFKLNMDHLAPTMRKESIIGNGKILKDFIKKSLNSQRLGLKEMRVINCLILTLSNHQCLNGNNSIDNSGENFLSVLLNLNFDYAILADLPVDYNFILQRMSSLHTNIISLNKTDWCLLLKYLFNSLRKNLENNFEYDKLSGELSFVLSCDSNFDLNGTEEQINNIIVEMKNSIEGQPLRESSSIKICLTVIDSVNSFTKETKNTFIALILFADYLLYFYPNALSLKCINIIMQIFKNNDFLECASVFKKDEWILYFDNLNINYQKKFIEILNHVYSENCSEDGQVIEYESVVVNLQKVNESIFAEKVDQEFKDDLVRDILENRRNRSCHGLLWYIKYANDNKEFRNQLSSEHLRMILEYLESNQFSDLPLLNQKEWTILIKRKYIELIREEQSFCCIA